ncbi:MAG: M14 family zinc carboxypeptidase [Urechidicola sp.]|nr:M14 family zinc carboxypeptidase [Urechidicola sp.]
MQSIKVENIEKWYARNYESNLYGLRILYNDISPLVKELKFENELLGYSTNGIPIHKIKIGNGPKRILIWSQMHGNESTGTKALFDLFKFLADSSHNSKIIKSILETCTLICIPMLNPDGAINYTRENAVNIDLNRDAVDKKGVESNLLRNLLDSFNPHFCFNLHDQRTLFNVSGFENPATISFLAPSEDITRKVTKGRTETMSVIVAMNDLLQKAIPNHIGRYTDEFYPTATGDNFQKLGHNTILIEAGHFPNDYEREITRKYNFFAMLQGIYFLSITNDYNNYHSYFDIPNNDKFFFDIIYINAKTKESNDLTDIGVLFKYKIINNKLVRYVHIEKTGDLNYFYAHSKIDLKGKLLNQ